MRRAILTPAILVACLLGQAVANDPLRKLELHTVATPIKSYRLLAMSMDDEDFIWAGSTHQQIHRYDPRTGAVENVPLPNKADVVVLA